MRESSSMLRVIERLVFVFEVGLIDGAYTDNRSPSWAKFKLGFGVKFPRTIFGAFGVNLRWRPSHCFLFVDLGIEKVTLLSVTGNDSFFRPGEIIRFAYSGEPLLA